MGAYFHHSHAILIAGIIGCAVGDDLVLGAPGAIEHGAQRAGGALTAAAPPRPFRPIRAAARTRIRRVR